MSKYIKPKEVEAGDVIKLHEYALATYLVKYRNPARRRYHSMGGDWVYPIRLRGMDDRYTDQNEYTSLVSARSRVWLIKRGGA